MRAQVSQKTSQAQAELSSRTTAAQAELTTRANELDVKTGASTKFADFDTKTGASSKLSSLFSTGRAYYEQALSSPQGAKVRPDPLIIYSQRSDVLAPVRT